MASALLGISYHVDSDLVLGVCAAERTKILLCKWPSAYIVERGNVGRIYRFSKRGCFINSDRHRTHTCMVFLCMDACGEPNVCV